MKRILIVLALLAIPLAAYAAGEIKETPGTHVYQPRLDQSGSNVKVIETRNYAGVSKAYIDGEGDLTCHDLTVGGTFTLPSTNFASGLSIATNAAAFSSAGNLRVGTSGASNFTVAAVSGNTVVAGTLGVTGAVGLSSTLTGGASSDIAINTSKFNVTASTGDTSIGRDLAVTRNATVTGTLGVTGVTTITGGMVGGSASDIAINSSKFTVTASTGDTAVGRDLAVTRNETVGGTLGVTGATSLGAAFTGASVAAVKGVMTFVSASTDIANIVTETTATQTWTLTGLAAGDAVFLVSPILASSNPAALLSRCVASTNTITCYIANNTAADINPDAQTFTFLVLDLT